MQSSALACNDKAVYPEPAPGTNEMKAPEPRLQELFVGHDIPLPVRVAFFKVNVRTIQAFSTLASDQDKFRVQVDKLISDNVWKESKPDKVEPELWELLVITSKSALCAVWEDCNVMRKMTVETSARFQEDPTKTPAIAESDFTNMRSRWMDSHPDLALSLDDEPHRRSSKSSSATSACMDDPPSTSSPMCGSEATATWSRSPRSPRASTSCSGW